jgi:hypothetical protein
MSRGRVAVHRNDTGQHVADEPFRHGTGDWWADAGLGQALAFPSPQASHAATDGVLKALMGPAERTALLFG